jgi:maltose O-acetyltransferase
MWRLFQVVSGWAKAKYYFRKATSLGDSVSVVGFPTVQIKGALTVEKKVNIWSTFNKTQLYVHKGGELRIGENTFINGAMITATRKVNIGSNVKIGPFSIIIDSDFHDTKNHLKDEEGLPITIHDNVWITTRVTILKGVTIGQGAVVATGAVVVKDVPPYSVVAGVPAKVIKTLK